jgi:tetratricopeptide (TPR) repeat protein
MLKIFFGFKNELIFLYCILAVTAISDFSLGFQTENLFSKGNEYYIKNDFEKAVEAYENLIKSGYEGASLYYNLGNAYYRQGKLGYAILNYERALKLSPGDEDIQHNLALANANTIDKIDDLPKFFIFQWWEGLLALFPISGWTITAYILYFLVLASVGLYSFSKNQFRYKYILISGLTSFSLLLIVVVLLIVKVNREINIKNGIIIEQLVNVKLSPGYQSDDAFIVHEGLKVKLEDEVNDWVKIKVQNDKIGWIPESSVKMIQL